MKHLQKQIHLEEFTSRMPSVIPAYEDNYGRIIWFNLNGYCIVDLDNFIIEYTPNAETLAESLTNQYNELDELNGHIFELIKISNKDIFSNYGMVPMSINIDYTFNEKAIKSRIISFYMLCQWYHFLQFYLSITQNTGCRDIPYVSAEDLVTTDTSTAYSLEQCIQWDNKVKDINNGAISLDNNSLREVAVILESKITNKFFPRINLTSDLYTKIFSNFSDDIINKPSYEDWLSEWGTGEVYPSTIYKWQQQYSDIYDKMVGIKQNYSAVCNSLIPNDKMCDCGYGNTICCDCMKYIRYGGNKMYDAFTNFINEYIPVSVKDIDNAYINITEYVGNIIDDMGEYSILAEEWEPGVNYNNHCEDAANNNLINGGAIVKYNGNDWILSDDPKDKCNRGYIYSTKYKEMYFGSIDGMTTDERALYDDNTPLDLDPNYANPTQFKRKHNAHTDILNNTYSFDENGRLIYSNNLPDGYPSLSHVLARKYPVLNNNGNGYVVIESNIYDIKINVNLVVYKNINYVINFYGKTPYILINGQKYYGSEANGKYIFKLAHGQILESEVCDKPVIIINNIVIMPDVNANYKYNGLYYPKVNSYALIEGKYVYINNDKTCIYILNGDVYYWNETDGILGKQLNDNNINEKSFGYSIINNTLYWFRPYSLYNTDTIEAVTESKLSSFAAKFTSDALGNQLHGVTIEYDNNGDISILSTPPKEGDTLKLCYWPGLTAHLSLMSKKTRLFKTVERYWGDIITKMTFYFIDVNYKPIEATIKSMSINDKPKKYNDTISCINACFEALETTGTKNATLMCDVEYHNGCIIEREVNLYNNMYSYSDFKIANINDMYCDGVTYHDVVTLTKEKEVYHTLGSTFEIFYYNMSWRHINNIDNSINLNTIVPASYITFPTSWSVARANGEKDAFVEFPLIREEYKLGSSSLENIDDNIYIDRGTERAIDTHLKLLEVNSLEALEQYNNGFFKIIKNS